jgi:hypothetical protein
MKSVTKDAGPGTKILDPTGSRGQSGNSSLFLNQR